MIQELLYQARQFAAHRLGVSTVETVAANGGERQAAPRTGHFRPDHRGRYRFAQSYLTQNARALDIASGVGYGSAILGEAPAEARVFGVDLSSDAVAYGERHFTSDRVSLHVGNALTVDAPQLDGSGDPFDLIVSFETLEHLDAPALLPRLHSWLRDDGWFLASVPNEATLPFNTEQFPYHLRHYRPDEFRELLETGGFEVMEAWSQHDRASEELQPDQDGLFLVAACRKR